MEVFLGFKSFIHTYIPKPFRFIYVIATINLLIGLFFIAVNAMTLRYSGVNYLPWLWVYCLPVIAMLVTLAFYIDKQAPRIAFFTETYGTYFYIFIALATLANGIQLTPFPVIDHVLVALDRLLGFHTPEIMHWTYRHPNLPAILKVVYASIGYQMFLIPLILALFMQRDRVVEYFLIALITYTIGTLIYYFFPTEGPSYAIKSPYFMQVEHYTAIKFFKIHHYIPVHNIKGGMIAFPSFHVMWALIITYCTRKQWWLFIPVLLINIGVVFSTLLLGWHYLVDIFASLIIFSFVVYLLKNPLAKYIAQSAD